MQGTQVTDHQHHQPSHLRKVCAAEEAVTMAWTGTSCTSCTLRPGRLAYPAHLCAFDEVSVCVWLFV